MPYYRKNPCPCGSPHPSWWLTDGLGIELAPVCISCVDEKTKSYRPEILRPYTQADVDEPIEPEDY